MLKWMCLFLRKDHLLRCWGRAYINSIAKPASKKIGALICSRKFFSYEFALYLYKSTIWSCIEYCGYIWAGAPS